MEAVLIGVEFVLACVAGLLWLFKSDQQHREPSTRAAAGILFRVTLLFALLIGIWEVIPGENWNVFVGLIALLFLLTCAMGNPDPPTADGPFGFFIWGMVIAIPFLCYQFVLGFPIRMHPEPDNSAPAPQDDLHHRRGIARTTLRPTGAVIIDDREYSARTVDSSYLERGREILVTGSANGILLVVLNSEQESKGTGEDADHAFQGDRSTTVSE